MKKRRGRREGGAGGTIGQRRTLFLNTKKKTFIIYYQKEREGEGQRERERTDYEDLLERGSHSSMSFQPAGAFSTHELK